MAPFLNARSSIAESSILHYEANCIRPIIQSIRRSKSDSSGPNDSGQLLAAGASSSGLATRIAAAVPIGDAAC